MKDPQILSTFTPTAGRPASGTPVPPGPVVPALVFDACLPGVVLRALLFVEAVMGVGALYQAEGPMDWLLRLALLTSAALPATLGWLVVACSLKKPLGRLPVPGQYLAGALLGAASGLYGCALLAMAGSTAHPPWLAASATGALLAALLVAALVMRSRGRTPAATAARLTELQSRIRPHFLFNTLNSAIALVRAEPAKAESLLEDLSDLFRHALIDQGPSVTLAQELILAERYLAIEQVRFGERLRVDWKLDPTAGEARLPPLLLQPLVENAVKHGVEASPEGASIQVRTQRRRGQVRIDIVNTLPPVSGRLPPSTPGHGIALANVRDRLWLLHDVESQFSAGVRDGRYHVRIMLPA